MANPPTFTQQVQGPPLRAVYKDAVVGIRYLHPFPRDPSAPSVSLIRIGTVGSYIGTGTNARRIGGIYSRSHIEKSR
jgi:hypothetical protein